MGVGSLQVDHPLGEIRKSPRVATTLEVGQRLSRGIQTVGRQTCKDLIDCLRAAEVAGRRLEGVDPDSFTRSGVITEQGEERSILEQQETPRLIIRGVAESVVKRVGRGAGCLLYTSPSPRDS